MPSKSKRGHKPELRMNQVPTVAQLVNNLGFESASRPDTEAFHAAVHLWRKNYKTDYGLPGTELLQWNDNQVQIDLDLMAEKFVLNHRTGEISSTERDWFDGSYLEYPDDKKEYVVNNKCCGEADFSSIISNLKQLFWRQNRYAEKNANYLPSLRDAWKISTTSTTTNAGHMKAKQSFNYNSHSDSISTTKDTSSEEQLGDGGNAGGWRSGAEQTQPVVVDEFDGPNDSNIEEPTTTATNKRRITDTDFESSPRRTDRKRAARAIPGFVLGEEVDNIFSEYEQATIETANEFSPDLPWQSTDHSFPDFDAPVAPMGLGEQTVLAAHVPELGTSVGADNTRPDLLLKLKLVSKPKPLQVSSPRVKTIDITAENGSKQTTPRGSASPKASEPANIKRTFHYIEDDLEEDNDSFEVQAKNRQSEASRSVHKSSQIEHQEGNSPRDSSHMVIVNKSHTRDTGVTRKSVTPNHLGEKSTKAATPSPIQEASAETIHEPTPSPPMVKQSKEQVNSKGGTLSIQLWIITRDPKYTEELCSSLKFRDSSLETFTSSIASITQNPSVLESIKLDLQTPTFSTKLTVVQGDEESWEAAKIVLAEKFKTARSEAKKQGKVANVKILVEPLYKETLSASNVDEDEDEDEEVDY